MANHQVKVSSVYWKGGYAVLCSKCNKIGRGVDPDRKQAKKKAWDIAGKHRRQGGTLGA